MTSFKAHGLFVLFALCSWFKKWLCEEVSRLVSLIRAAFNQHHLDTLKGLERRILYVTTGRTAPGTDGHGSCPNTDEAQSAPCCPVHSDIENLALGFGFVEVVVIQCTCFKLFMNISYLRKSVQ